MHFTLLQPMIFEVVPSENIVELSSISSPLGFNELTFCGSTSS